MCVCMCVSLSTTVEVRFSSPSYSASESEGVVSVCVDASFKTPVAVTVNFTVISETARGKLNSVCYVHVYFNEHRM